MNALPPETAKHPDALDRQDIRMFLFSPGESTCGFRAAPGQLFRVPEPSPIARRNRKKT